MKNYKDVTALVLDYGSFAWLANDLGKSFKKVYYSTPHEREFQSLGECCIGDGLEGCERLDDWMEHVPEIDLFIFPDIAMVGAQKYLRSIGKPVWGSFDATELEMSRTKFLEFIKESGLPVAKSEVVEGVSNLESLIRKSGPKWIKINRFRNDMETWKHNDWLHSERDIEDLSKMFGGAKEEVVFVVQDVIDSDLEIGFDGLSVGGWYPAETYMGPEKKNELYLGAKTKYSKMPDALKRVNEAIKPYLKKIGYRNFLATEVRVAKDGTPYFIDPTFRMPGQTGEHMTETCSNLAEVIWAGANGEHVEPKLTSAFVAEATIIETGDSDGWKVLEVPEKVSRWTKLYHYCEIDGVAHFPPRDSDELGVIIGAGSTINLAIKALKQNFEAFSSQPVMIRDEGFASLLADIQKSEAKGIDFTEQKVPDPASVVAK